MASINQYRDTNLTVVGTVEVFGLGPWWEGEGADGPVSRHIPGLQHEAQEGALRAPHQLHIHAPAWPHSQAGHLEGFFVDYQNNDVQYTEN
jgi:hypothetical protein